MNNTVWLWAVVATACGGSDATPDASTRACQDMGGSACFQLPTAPLQNRDGAPSVLGCGPIVPTPSPSALTISGTVLSYGTSKPIVGASIKLYSSASFENPFATTTSQADATYSIDIPANTPDLIWGELSATGFLPLFPHQIRINLGNGNITEYGLRDLTADNVESAALLVKEIWDPASMVGVGTVLDCNRMVVMHAAVALSSTAGTRTFVPGARMYYGSPGAVPLAVPPDERGDTNDNGTFVAFGVPPGPTLYLQAWGFKDAAAQAQGEAGLTLVGETQLHNAANTVANISLWTR